jgi:MFS family permease
MESASVPIRGGWRRLRHSASFVSLSSLSKADRASTGEVTPLDWWAVLGIQALSMISILSSTMIFSTAVFMLREWGAADEAQAAARAGLMIAAKPGFSAMSSYAWGRRGDVHGFRSTMLISAFVTALLTAVLGAVSSFHWALALRALTGLCDGVMTLTKSAMAKISDKTNSAKAFSTFGVTYGLGSSVGPTAAALLAYPCGGDPNDEETRTSGLFPSCPSRAFRSLPFLLSTAWVGALGCALWTFSFLRMRIPEEGRGEERRGARDSVPEDDASEIEMASAAVVRPLRDGGSDGGDNSKARDDRWAVAAVVVAESDESDGEVEDERSLLTRTRRANRESRIATGVAFDSASRFVETPPSGKAPRREGPLAKWHADPAIRLATHAQVWCALVVITGAELTPMWMATSVSNGGLEFTSVDIGAFGGIVGLVVLAFAATLFSKVANAFGVTAAVRWALFANGIVYIAHPLAWYAEKRGYAAITWTLIACFAFVRGCAGPVAMGGVSLILNNSAPRNKIGAVNGFAGTFTNVARAAAPVVAGALVAGMVHATRTLGAGDAKSREKGSVGFTEYDVAEALPPTWWPFALLSACFFLLSRMAAKMPRSLDAPREDEEG